MILKWVEWILLLTNAIQRNRECNLWNKLPSICNITIDIIKETNQIWLMVNKKKLCIIIKRFNQVAYKPDGFTTLVFEFNTIETLLKEITYLHQLKNTNYRFHKLWVQFSPKSLFWKTKIHKKGS